jgi:hypothetical protein
MTGFIHIENFADRMPFSRLRRILGVFAVLALLIAPQSLSPTGQAPRLNQINPRSDSPFGEYGDPADAQRRLKALNEERQKSLVADTAKLLKLARELDEEVARTDPADLTPDQLRKISDMEKLARSVKQKMSLAVGGGPDLRPISPQLLPYANPAGGPG